MQPILLPQPTVFLRLLHFLFRPFCNTLIGDVCQIFSFNHLCTFGSRFYPFHTARDSASSTGTEWNNLLSFQIIRFQKSTDNHRLLTPPDGITCICQVWDKKIFFLFYIVIPKQRTLFIVMQYKPKGNNHQYYVNSLAG